MKIQGTTVATPIARRAVTDDKSVSKAPWSSKHTVDTLCPAFEESGSVVTCEPVEGYPLEVVSKIIPKQSGSGEPSPENVRPISAWTGAKLWHGGKNLLPDGWKDWSNYVDSMYLLDLPVGRYCISGKFDTSADRFVYLEKSTDGGKTWTVAGAGANSTGGYILGGTSVRTVVFDVTDNPDEKYAIWTRAGDIPYIESMQIDIGSVATECEPYRGEEITIDFGQAVYGGSYNWKTGLLTIDHATAVFDGTESGWYLNYSGEEGFSCGVFRYPNLLDKKLGYATSICSHFKNTNNGSAFKSTAAEHGLYCDHPDYTFLYVDWGTGETTLAEFKAWLAEQYANGTPVQVCYELAEPTTIQLTPQEILALSGVNTLYCDMGDTTVTGRADTTAVIEKLTNAIIALGGNV